jgi:hypothetical protein
VDVKTGEVGFVSRRDVVRFVLVRGGDDAKLFAGRLSMSEVRGSVAGVSERGKAYYAALALEVKENPHHPFSPSAGESGGVGLDDDGAYLGESTLERCWKTSKEGRSFAVAREVPFVDEIC